MTTERMTERKETDGEILTRLGTDAVAWAKEFTESVRAAAEREGVDAGDLALDPTPGGMLHAWFCNAIEASRSVGASQEARTGNYRRSLIAAGVLDE